MRRSGRNRRRRARGIVKPRPDKVKELLLRAMLHAIFLCLMGLLELLQLVLDGFRSTGTFEDVIVQHVDRLRCVGEGFDR